MMVINFINRIAKYLVIIILFGSFIFGLIWLWQRQPKPQSNQEDQITSSIKNKPSEDSLITPQDLTVLTSQNVNFKGKTKANSLVAFWSNSFSAVTESDNDGAFTSSEVTIAKGLNQVKMAVISDKLTLESVSTLNYLSADNNKDGDIVNSGSVKKILDTLITVNTDTDDKNIRTLNAAFTFSQDLNSEEAALSPIKRIRIGDFIIAQGFLPKDKEDNQLKANKIQVFRENIPINTRSLAIAKIITSPKQNKLSAKNLSDNAILDLTLEKFSSIILDGKEVKASDIEINKNAIIIYHPDKGKNLIDLIYLLSQ